MPPRPSRPQPEPLKTNDVHIAAAGTAAWMVALLVLLAVGLPGEDRWWLWVCLTGAGIGAFACLYIPRMQRKRAEEAPEGAPDGADGPPVS